MAEITKNGVDVNNGVERVPIWPDVAVLIPVYNTPELLQNCLQCLKDQDYEGNYSIIVIDNAVEFSLTSLRTIYPSVTFLHEPDPGSYNARNLGLAHAHAPFLAFTDADCSPHAAWLREGVCALMAVPDAGLAGGSILIQPVTKGTPTTAEFLEMAAGFPQKTYIEKERFAATANMFTRRTVFDDVGLFNGALKSGGDHDWGRRVAAKNYALIYAEKAVVGHPARLSGEITAKLLRTVGGARDRAPSWGACLKFCARYMIPPRKRLVALARFSHPDLGMSKKAAVMAYCVYINWLAAFYRLRLQITGGSSAR